jgi:2,4-dienoyl-CoA reductase-like NADH-dependent reductase (Old Yellow Enzyme family)
MKMLEPLTIGKTTFRNRVVRSATYEGRCDVNGFPAESYTRFYETLAKKELGALITGFAYTSVEGRAMQPLQAGIDNEDKIDFYKRTTDAVHQHGCPIFLQISHAGRQTLSKVTGTEVRSSFSKKSNYFNEKPKPFSTQEVYAKVNEYIRAAEYAEKTGFDGIQLHAAHGYLIHQFILPGINKRNDEFGIDKEYKIGTRFFKEIIEGIRNNCSDDFLILVKVSGSDDLGPNFSLQHFKNLIRFLEKIKVDAIEISYGTMDHALNIFRGDMPVDLILSVNPIIQTTSTFRKFINKSIIQSWYRYKQKPFSKMYNLDFAKEARKMTDIPIITVGGFRSGSEIEFAVSSGFADLVGLSRPLICEPDFISKIKKDITYQSACVNCNYCAIMCDSGKPTHCYKSNKKEDVWNFSAK